jgi:SPW repeat
MTERWIDIAIGGWLVISPWVLGFSESVLIKWSSVICGVALVVINAWALSDKENNLKK